MANEIREFQARACTEGATDTGACFELPDGKKPDLLPLHLVEKSAYDTLMNEYERMRKERDTWFESAQYNIKIEKKSREIIQQLTAERDTFGRDLANCKAEIQDKVYGNSSNVLIGGGFGSPDTLRKENAELREQIDKMKRGQDLLCRAGDVALDTLREVCEALEKYAVRDVVEEWKHYWMNQTQNSKEDYENYWRRAFGVDANMVHSLANRISKIEALVKARELLSQHGKDQDTSG